MSQKTYLQIVNNVLTNLRESTVTDLTADYSLLIGEFVNMAKEQVEDSWQWHVLRQDITFNSVASQTRYDLTDDTAGSGDADVGSNLWEIGKTQALRDRFGRIQMWDLTNDSDRFMMAEVPRQWGVNQQRTTNPNTAPLEKPVHVFLESGAVNFVYAPQSSGRDYTLTVVTPQAELSTAGTTVSVPWRPIVSLATAWAMEERGEKLGPRSQLWFARAEADLAKAIANDSDYDPDELVMDAGQILWQGGRA